MDFGTFLRARTNDLPRLITHQSQHYPQAVQAFRKMANQQYTPAGHRSQPIHETAQDQPHYQLGWHPRSNSEASATFDQYTLYPDEMYAATKNSVTLPMFEQAVPSSVSFRPMEAYDNSFSTLASSNPGETAMPGKIENTHSLPTPTVLSQYVDTSKYEALHMNDWLNAPTDYAASPTSSENTVGSSPFIPSSEEGEWFVDHYFRKHSTPGTQTSSAGNVHTFHPPNTALELSFSETQASWPLSRDGDEFAPGALPSPDDMFGYPPVVPPAHFNNPPQKLETVSPSLPNIARPTSSQSDGAASMASTSHSHYQVEETIDDRQDRDQLLVDMRRQNYSYREIKRLGGFREAESTLRGRVRTLTKDKSERVRRPQWKSGDVGLQRSFGKADVLIVDSGHSTSQGYRSLRREVLIV